MHCKSEIDGSRLAFDLDTVKLLMMIFVSSFVSGSLFAIGFHDADEPIRILIGAEQLDSMRCAGEN